jgi:hypothetical protein
MLFLWNIKTLGLNGLLFYTNVNLFKKKKKHFFLKMHGVANVLRTFNFYKFNIENYFFLPFLTNS